MELYENSKLRNIFIGGAILGLLIFVIGLALSFKIIYIDIKDKKSSYGIITNINHSTTRIAYNVNNKQYEKVFNFTSSTYYVGKKVKVYYDPIHVGDVKIASMRYLILIMPGFGILFTGIAGVGLIYVYIKTYGKNSPYNIS